MTIVTSLVTIQNTQIITYHTIWPNKSSYLCPGFPIVGGGTPAPSSKDFFRKPPIKTDAPPGAPPSPFKTEAPPSEKQPPHIET